MEIWLETVDLECIEKASKMGILFGVTTNPTLIAKSGSSFDALLQKILQLQKGPVAVHVTASHSDGMIQQAEALAHFSNRMMVSIPATSEGMKAIHHCFQKKIPTVATAVFDQNQVMIAASAGASYIAPYFSWICEDDLNGIESVRGMLRFLRLYNSSLKLLATSLGTAEHVKECAEMGAHAVSVEKKVFKALIEDHPMTVRSQNVFAKDWLDAKKGGSIPF